MAVPLEEFVKQLEDSGILASETIKDFMPPNASPKDANELAKELVRRKKLTKFQAEEVYRGKGKSLLLGNYVLLEEIGAGGMGQVFKARHRRMDRFVAIKLLPPATTKDKAAIERFEREVKASAKISHPNVVAAYDSDCANGVHFLVMELVEGKDLAALVKRNGPFSISQAVNCVLQAARGLEVAHKKGIIHRDIKPANLLMDTEGTVKILDMGLARLSVGNDGDTQADLTSTGTIMGTVDYMAPEQALDTKTADARADVYALGCSMFYLLTGKSTYDGDTIMKKLLAHREQPIPSLVACRPDASQQLDAVFQKMVAKQLEDRYQSMSEVIADLEPLEDGSQSTVTIQQSANINLDNSAATGFIDLPVTQTIRQTTVKKSVPAAKSKVRQPPWKNTKVLIGAALFGVLLLAGIIISLDTKDGKLIVEVDQPDAMVQVLDSEGKVEISQKAVGGKIVISVDPGKHRLKVVKDGFTTYGQEFELEKGGKKEITAKLIPVAEKTAMAGTESTSSVQNSAEQTPLFFETPAFAPWAKEVAAMPGEKQIEAVSKKLMDLNAGFDGMAINFAPPGQVGKSTPKIENGVVTEIGFITDNVTDISPVRALVGLKAFWCADSGGYKGKLSDLSPLRGMLLAKLTCGGTQVSDLLPLEGMPLLGLRCNGTQVESLSPLQGMSLTYLNCGTTLVSDLSPLSGMPLTQLQFYSTKVSDLEPLRGMPLTQLEFYDTKVSDLAPLRGMNLDVLNCNNTQVSNLSSLVGMKIQYLDIQDTGVTDMSPLKDMPLLSVKLDFNLQRDTELLRSIKTLTIINEKPVTEFWKGVEEQQTAASNEPPLFFQLPTFEPWAKEVAAMPAEKQIEEVSKKLIELNPGFDGQVAGYPPVWETGKSTPKIENGVVTEIGFFTDNVTDISPVRALVGLKAISCGDSGGYKGKLSDLSPLRGMPIARLACAGTKVSDLLPLQGMPLIGLKCNGTKVESLLPLQGMSLTYLNCGTTLVSDLSPLSGMPLTDLRFYNTEVSDLAPLRGMKLTFMDCNSTQVSDLSPLVGMKLEYLQIHFNAVADLSPLKDMPLNNLKLDFNPRKDTELLRSIQTLETINDKPVAEFWKDVEE